ncbi:3344_t:CDS:2, partial [Cetraspora pellucida]
MSQTAESSQHQQRKRQPAYELPCALASSVSLHDGSGLLECETKERQTIRHQIHYNQLIVSDFLRQVLTSSNYKNKRQAHNLDLENELVEKQARTEHAYEIEVEKNTCEIGIQTDEFSNKNTRDIGIQTQLSIKMNEIENLQKQLDYAYDYVIEKELITEKSQEINTIDQIMKNQKGIGSHSKWCKKCNTTNIDNKKRTCPNCNEKLDTLAALQAESANELIQ